ncbi:DNA-binding pseudobarrel domain-containing protein [Artemisia annua]|uniref:DNA-binding pseudobarrel domain-containing protein n=1 Tax=Artemisia annua TaxID=35608 RepID=A0A2U1NY33_ARTAN|nr:DNA-binding pseudobarrel domain-containing protein [Artemisia annua]
MAETAQVIEAVISDLQIDKTPKSLEAQVTIAHASPLASFAPFTPSAQIKRKRLKPARYDLAFLNEKKKASKNKAVRDPSKASLSSAKKKTTPKDPNAPVQISPTMIRAEEIQSSLGNEFPTFKKLMLASHVTRCFWMGIPTPFCRSFLPQHDFLVIAEGENGKQYELKYLAHKTGLSAGWRTFAVSHKLHEGDVLIFQLVASCKFKVHIVRASDSKEVDGTLTLFNHDVHMGVSDSKEVDGALNLLNHDAHTGAGDPKEADGTPDLSNHDAHTRASDPKEVDGTPDLSNHDAHTRASDPKEVDGTPELLNHDAHTRASDPKEVDGTLDVPNHNVHTIRIPSATWARNSKPRGRKRLGSSSPPLAKVQKKKQNMSESPTQISNHTMDSSGVNSEVHAASPEPNVSSEKLKTFKDFRIRVNKQCIDSELSEEIRKTYFKLCIRKKEILHNGVRKGLYPKLVAGMIGEMVNIANMIKNCNFNTTKEEFEVWDSSLKSFELMGMKVGFLRDRIHELIALAFESEDAKRYMEASEEQKQNANTIQNLEEKLLELKENNKKIDAIVSSLKEKMEKNEVEFKKHVDAPW